MPSPPESSMFLLLLLRGGNGTPPKRKEERERRSDQGQRKGEYLCNSFNEHCCQSGCCLLLLLLTACWHTHGAAPVFWPGQLVRQYNLVRSAYDNWHRKTEPYGGWPSCLGVVIPKPKNRKPGKNHAWGGGNPFCSMSFPKLFSDGGGWTDATKRRPKSPGV